MTARNRSSQKPLAGRVWTNNVLALLAWVDVYMANEAKLDAAWTHSLGDGYIAAAGRLAS